jgi:DNA-binding GntR family transcriptional regulator
MELERVDTQRAYDIILAKITTLELAPGAAINEQRLAEELNMGTVPVREALKLLAHDSLVVITPRHGLYVADVSRPDLEQISELRLSLESLCARLAAQRATPDDLVVLEVLRQEQAAQAEIEATTDLGQASQRLFELDHKFHQAVAQAAHNRYLARTLDQFYGLSQRLWYLALPGLGFLPASVEKHLELVEAIKAGDADRAEQVMHDHVQEFYDRVRGILVERGLGTNP